jgi:hypothetical protein
MRRLLIILVGLVVVLAVGCGGGDGGDGNGGAGTPVGEVACQMPDDIESYRYSMLVMMEAPEGSDEAAGSELLGGLTEMRVEGAFVVPDRGELLMEYGGTELRGITIGDDAWVKLGDTDWQEATEQTGRVSFAGDVCEGFAMPDIGGVEASEERVNDLDTYHYHLVDLETSDVTQFLAGGRVGETGVEELGAVLQEGTLDVWLAVDGNWPVRIEGQFTLEDEEGVETEVSLSIDVKDVNDPDIKIEPPIG